MNKKVILLAAVILLVSWGGNLFYYESLMLDEPLFLKHYYDLSGYNGSYFSIDYLINKDKKWDVNWIEIPGTNAIRIEKSLAHDEEVYSHHILRKINLQLTERFIEDLKDKGVFHISDIIVHYGNGKEKRVNIGKINIKNINTDEYKNSSLKSRSSGSSSAHKEFNTFISQNSATIEKIDYNFKNRLDGFLDIAVSKNNQQIENRIDDNKYKFIEEQNIDKMLPMELDKGDYIKFNTRFHSRDTDDDRYYNYYIVYIDVIGKNSQGAFIENMECHYYPYLDEGEIKKLVRKRGIK